MRFCFIFFDFASVMILFFFTQVAPLEVRDNSMTIGVADEHVGLVLGRNGRSIIEISQVCEEVTILPGFLYVLSLCFYCSLVVPE